MKSDAQFWVRIVVHPEAILQTVRLIVSVSSCRPVVRHRHPQTPTEFISIKLNAGDAPRYDGTPWSAIAAPCCATYWRGYRPSGSAEVDVKVAFGRDPHAALGAVGRWNVGPWSPAVEFLWEGKPPGG